MLFARPCGGKIEVPHETVATLLQFRQVEEESLEAGGMLFGRFLKDCDDIVVDTVTTPFPGDQRGLTFFVRQDPRHEEVLLKHWNDSGGTCNYLGEWHTHPEPNPALTPWDVCNMRHVVRDSKFEGDSLLFIVVGTSLLRMWEVSRDSLAIVPLRRIVVSRGYNKCRKQDA